MSRKRHHGRTKMAILHFFCWWFVFMKIGHAVRSITMDQWPSQVVSGANITLGCSFVPEIDYVFATMEVAWHFRSNSHWTVVYYYVNQTAQLVDQDRRFHGRAWIVPKELKEEKASLSISSVRLTDRGEYRCIVMDSGGAAFDSASLTVLGC
ncbi:butyrophilin subfamily 1 member A1-like isoform X2 [Protopterus annectens]|uniref:butyrophilin subfamily 1 member A1-like isoform X2 n=1 Tax=Protopterus annectens TaxID=7888 RepID=UPI001CF9F520|nr:butyrophilin subfamily 1 member A1-like isoform X2 [Protopterus annectens]